MKARTAILIGLALLLAPLFLVQAQIPRTLSYQGIVTDAAGEIKPDGTYSFTFRLYDALSGGTALWTEVKTLSVKDGLFSTALGDQVVFPASLRFDRPYWLSIQVASEAELSPRIPLTSVGYSFTALRADSARHAVRADTASLALSVEIAGDSHSLDAADGDPTDVVYVDTVGYVGIGTTSPGYELDVAGTVNAVAFRGDGSQLTNIDSPDWYGGGSVSADLWRTGNIGVGVSNPTAKLDLVAEDANNNVPTTVLELSHFSSSPGDGIATRIGMVTSSSPSSYRDAAYIDAIMSDLSTETSALSFWTRNSGTMGERVRIDGAGNVGIGTTSPAHKLVINTDTDLDGIYLNDLDGTTKARLLRSFGGWAYFQLNDASGINKVNLNANGDSYFSGGNVGIGTGNPDNILTVVQSSATDPIADSWGVYSSRRWKTNIQPMEGALDKVQRLRGVTYDWKADGKHDIGLIAEEVGEVIPEVVAYEENGIDAKSVDYARLVAVLIEAVKEQQNTIEQQTAEIGSLKETMVRFESALETLEGFATDQENGGGTTVAEAKP